MPEIMQHHAYVVEGPPAEGVSLARSFVAERLGMASAGNPDVIVLTHGLLSVDDARNAVRLAAQAPVFHKTKALILSAERVYHEAQNALLKLFEEPPAGTYLFLCVPNTGMLLPTLRSRVQILDSRAAHAGQTTDDVGEAAFFLQASSAERSARIKKLSSGKDDDTRRENRLSALALIDGVEAAAVSWKRTPETLALLRELEQFRSFLYERSAPVKMILEHLAIVLPRKAGGGIEQRF